MLSHARTSIGQIKYDVTNAKQFHVDACGVFQNISWRQKCIVSSRHQIAQTLILSLFLCPLHLLQTVQSRFNRRAPVILKEKKKNNFLIYPTHSPKPHCFISGHNELYQITGCHIHSQYVVAHH